MEVGANKSEILEIMHILVGQIQLQRFRTTPEKSTQSDVEQFLTNYGLEFQREKRLTKKDIPDFLIQSDFGGIVVEVKTKCSRMAIYRQLERYAEYKEVDGLILLTGTSMGLPSKINGKPAIVASLGAGWL
jgi:hypothetical protein